MTHFTGTNIYLGNQFELVDVSDEWVRIHIGGKFYPQGENGRVLFKDKEGFLNWEDLSDESHFDISELVQILDFLDHNKDNPIFIHCEYAQSRSPAIVMTYLSKRTEILQRNFYGALDGFVKLYPGFVYPSGITKFLKNNWNKIT